VILGVLIRVAWSGLDIRYHLSYTRLTYRVHTSLCSAKLTSSLAVSLCLVEGRALTPMPRYRLRHAPDTLASPESRVLVWWSQYHPSRCDLPYLHARLRAPRHIPYYYQP